MAENNDPDKPIGRAEFYQAMMAVFTFIMMTSVAQLGDDVWLPPLLLLCTIVIQVSYLIKWANLRKKPDESGTESDG